MDADNSMLVSDDSDSSEDGGYLQALRQLKRLRVQSTLTTLTLLKRCWENFRNTERTQSMSTC